MRSFYVFMRRTVKRMLNAMGVNQLLHWITFSTERPENVEYRGCLFLCGTRTEYERQLREERYNEDRIIQCFEKALEGRRGLFVDAGANIGVFSITLGRLPGLRVLALEPEPLNYRSLRRNLAANPQSRVEPYRLACSNCQGTFLDFTIPFGRNRGIPFVGRYPEAPFFAIETRVPCVTLDAFLHQRSQDLCGFKIDVEGHELEVVRGFERTLRKTERCVGLIELHPHLAPVDPVVFRDFFSDLSFSIQELDRQGNLTPYVPKPGAGHAIWVVKDAGHPTRKDV